MYLYVSKVTKHLNFLKRDHQLIYRPGYCKAAGTPSRGSPRVGSIALEALLLDIIVGKP